MRKMHTALLAGAVVVGLSAVAGLAAFAPSLVGQKTATHELTMQLPGGGTETIAYTGKVAPSVTFHTPQFVFSWSPLSFDWMVPSLMVHDPFIATIDRHLNMFANTPLPIPSAPDQLLGPTTLSGLPAGTSYSVVSETIGNGVCTHFTQITKAKGDAKPRVVSQSSGNCENSSNQPEPSRPTQAVNLRSTTGPTTAHTM